MYVSKLTWNLKEAELTTCGKDILLSKIKDKRMCCLMISTSSSVHLQAIDIYNHSY